MRKRAPNVVLFLVDTLRGDRLSYAGHCRQTSPHLERLAEESVVYANAVSPGAWTVPSHASIFTGTYPSRHGIDRTHPYLDCPMTVLPEYMKQHGYRTFGVSSNFFISGATCYDRGFDVFNQSWQLLQTRLNPGLEKQRLRDPSYKGTPRPPLGERVRTVVNRLEFDFWRYCCTPFVSVDMGAGRVNRLVQGWMREWRRDEAPFFAFIHYMEPHLPYRPKARFVKRHLAPGSTRRAWNVNQNAVKFMARHAPMDGEDLDLLGRLYDAEVSYADECIHEVVEALRSAGLLDDTLLIFTSDHGENLGEHGLMDHMFSVHEPVVHVPLLVRYPGGRPRGVERGLVQTLDIFPTVASVLADGGWNGDGVAAQFQGRPLPPLGGPRDFAVTELREVQPPIPTCRKRFPEFDWRVYDRSLCAIRTPTHKYIQGSDGSEELFALDTDPGETTNRAAAEPATTAALRASLVQWRGSFAPTEHAEPAPELDAEIRRRLADLGYLDD